MSAPEVEPWKGQANFPKLRGRPCSERWASGRGLRRRCAALAEVDGEGGSELGVGGIEGLAEFEELLVSGVGCESCIAGQGDDGARGGRAGEVGAGLGGGEIQAGVVGGGFECWGGCVCGCAHGFLRA